MQPFQIVTGPAIPFRRPNTDTDVIIRIERLSELQRHELGPYAFEALRRRADQTDDPDCVFNRDVYKGAPILIAGENFGCGSSREGAVWAIAELGIRCIIAPSFADIFYNNCFKNGVLPVKLPQAQVDQLMEHAESGSNARLS
ncbi:MAG: 3-isopropylmalate dehydratase small subunit, partial [Pseudomonadota bacterium]